MMAEHKRSNQLAAEAVVVVLPEMTPVTLVVLAVALRYMPQPKAELEVLAKDMMVETLEEQVRLVGLVVAVERVELVETVFLVVIVEMEETA
jgi:hypothetical protein